MFYENQPIHLRSEYKKMLSLFGSLSIFFSDSPNPYLVYRAHENIFCKYFVAENLARSDTSADAKKGDIGIGLKTWIGNDDQKVAEFGRLREKYMDLSGLELAKQISFYRNERIRITKNLHNLSNMVYHIVKRVTGKMLIIEYPFDYINIDNIKLLPQRGNSNNTYFTDNKNVYHFSTSKNTLYMIFDNYLVLDSVDVKILDDPYTFLMDLALEKSITSLRVAEEKPAYRINKLSGVSKTPKQICLRLYSTKNSNLNYVYPKSGLNQWNASGRVRDPNEVYIPYPSEDRMRNTDFFPQRDIVFSLKLPNGNFIPAKVCQDNGKAIMSNPNKVLGKWLLRDVFELPEKTLLTYEMLETFGIDSVVFTKINDYEFSIDFAELGTYEDFYSKE